MKNEHETKHGFWITLFWLVKFCWMCPCDDD
jgi:hypothetical protein